MSDGEIVKLNQRTGQPGRPKQVEIRGSHGGNQPSRQTPQILGAAPPHGETEIVDRHTKQEPVAADVHVHVENVTTTDDIRRANLQEGEPEVRVRNMTAEGRAAWDSVKKDA